jgi:hypothetical protein
MMEPHLTDQDATLNEGASVQFNADPPPTIDLNADDTPPVVSDKPELTGRDAVEEAAARKSRDAQDRKLRAAQGIAEPSNDDDGDDDGSPPAAPDAQAPADQPRDREGKFAAKNVADDTKIRVKVNGEEREVTVEELRRNYQIEQAARQRMQSASDMQRQAAAMLETARQEAARIANANQTSPGGKPVQADTGDDEVDKLAEALAYGSKDTIKDALGKALRGQGGTQQAPALTPDAVQAEIDRRMRAWQVASEAQTDLRTFAERHPEIAKDDDLQVLVAQRAQRMMLEDLETVGADPRVLASLTPAQIGFYHREAVRLGYARPTMTIFDTAAKETKSKFAPPAQQALQSRKDAKANLSKPTPAASVRAPAPQAPKPKTPADIIAEERASRGLRYA